MKNIGDMMKQAQELQAKLAEFQNQLDALEIEGQAGAGMVRITLNGKGEMRRIAIDPSLMTADDREVLEDLITAAHNDAKEKCDARVQEETQKMTGGLGLPPGLMPGT